MRLAVDLHSHSGYAGGVGNIKLEDVIQTMKRKGIDVFGAGDVLFPKRTEELREVLTESSEGLFSLNSSKEQFALQTEIILSVRLEGYKRKIMAHHVVLFPDFESIKKMQKLMTKWGQKNTIGRPFIVSDDLAQQTERLFEIKNIHPLVEVIPAHVMTPEGILGSKNMLESINEFYGEFTDEIQVVETGLSADPYMLEQIEELADMTMISNSDCHSAALNRIGREFTMLDVQDRSYKGIVEALRTNKVEFTAEFNPAEGRYYNTGHRADRQGHEEAYISDNPKETVCPICNKPFLPGVERRVKQLSSGYKAKHTREFHHLLPLIEAIALAIGVKSITSKRVVERFNTVLDEFDTEIAFWLASKEEILKKLDGKLEGEILMRLLKVHDGKFSFQPPGFDGNYGVLSL